MDQLTVQLQFGGYHHVVEADIKGFFDNLSHDWLMRMLAERIDDQAILRLIKKWLKAGVLDTNEGAQTGRWYAAGWHHLAATSKCVPALRARFVVRESVPAKL